ncbi:MAG TPA: hypothetical protein VEI97_03890, partial [bacterium]|nr:hypothetical protein [bacterium]
MALRFAARRAPGISLVEVVFAAALLAIVAVGYMGALSTSVGVSVTSQDFTTAAALAQQELELLRATPFSDVPYAQTGTPSDLEEVPDYLTNIVEARVRDGSADIRTTGTYTQTTTPQYFSDSAIADGLTMDET